MVSSYYGLGTILSTLILGIHSMNTPLSVHAYIKQVFLNHLYVSVLVIVALVHIS